MELDTVAAICCCGAASLRAAAEMELIMTIRNWCGGGTKLQANDETIHFTVQH